VNVEECFQEHHNDVQWKQFQTQPGCHVSNVTSRLVHFIKKLIISDCVLCNE